MKKFKKIVSTLLCGVMMISYCFTTMAATESTTKPTFRMPENVEVIPLKDMNSSLKQSNIVAEPRNNMGQPRDIMKFYYIKVYPLIELDDGSLAYLNFSMEMNSPSMNTGGSGPSLEGSYNKAMTQQIYKDVAKYGYDLVGWRGEMKFRFDYITPYTWTYSLYGGTPVTEYVPNPHNPYQTYTYIFNTGLPSDYDTNYYYTGMMGKVSYKNNNVNQEWVNNFSCYIGFNSPN